MKLFACRWLAVSSCLICALAAGETRPQYGSTLRAATRIAPTSLDPADKLQVNSIARRNLTRLMFDTLVTLDDRGKLQPALATSWQAASGNQRWQFWIRRGVKFQDGSPLTVEAVAAALRTTNPAWRVSSNGDSVVIERDAPDADLPARLAEQRNAVTKRGEGGTLIGTGPFYIKDWQPGKKLSLSANEEYWGGRAYLDAIEIDMGHASRDQLISLELGKVDVAEVAAEQSQRSRTEGRRVVTSAPSELMALVFQRERAAGEDRKLREALAASIDRKSIRNAVLQDAGEPSGGILSGWVSGYGFVFTAEQNLDRARQLRSEVKYAPSWSLAYDADDPLARLIAERIALNAQDAGIRLQITTSGIADLRLTRFGLASVNPRIALTEAASFFGMATPKLNGDGVDELYRAESALLQTQRIVPLFQLPVSYALSPSVKDWSEDRDGGRHLEDVWLGSKP